MNRPPYGAPPHPIDALHVFAAQAAATLDDISAADLNRLFYRDPTYFDKIVSAGIALQATQDKLQRILEQCNDLEAID